MRSDTTPQHPEDGGDLPQSSPNEPANASAANARPKRASVRVQARRRSFTERLLGQFTLFSTLFILLVATIMGWDYGRRLAKDPLDSESFREVKASLAADPKNEEIKEEIRRQDLELRRAYFASRRRAEGGAVLLCVGALILIASLKTGSLLRRRLPSPVSQTLPRDPDQSMARIARWSVAVVALALAAGTFALGKTTTTHLTAAESPSPASPDASATDGDSSASRADSQPGASPGDASAAPSVAAVAGGYPSKDEVAKNWPYFRGPGGSGISPYTDIPTTWNVKTGENIVWKTPLPTEGNSSPVVWGDRIFLTGATPQARSVYSFDAATGKLLWQKEVAGPVNLKLPKVNEETGYASPTAATDGRRVYAMFATGDLAAFDFAGALVWSKHLGVPKNPYGLATSLTMWQNLLIVQYDQGSPKEKLSKLLAFDGATGKIVWQTPREMPSTWGTPILIDVQGKSQIFTVGEPWGIAYDPANGKEIWRADCLQQEIGPSPVFFDGVVFTVNTAPALKAIRANGQGDVTKTHVLWMGEDNLPDTCSPLATSKHVFLLTTAGILTCYDAKSGKLLWEQDFEVRFKSSPSLVGKNVYLAGDEGKVFVVEPTDKECKKIAQTEMGEAIFASPAFGPGKIYVRTKKHLFCIGKK
jgi:outer membrane protein assembly factor BamB